jgi:hypothetical protein
MNNNALPIKAAVVRFAVEHLRHVLVSVEPSMQAHDVWSMAASRRSYEWEIKQSISDLYREKQKPKHRFRLAADTGWGFGAHATNYFYIVIPEPLAEKATTWINRELPYAGIAIFKTTETGVSVPYVEISKRAQLLHKNRVAPKDLAMCARWMAVTLADLMASKSAEASC